MKSVKVAGLVLGAFLLMSLPASAAGRFRRGVFFGPTIGAWGWYDPFFYGAYGPYGVYPVYSSNASQLKLKTNVKDAEVFINGAYAGKASKLKSMWLRPDVYNLEVRAAGYAPYTERVYLIPGKTMQVNAELAAAHKS